MALQPGEDREFKNQFTEFLQKNQVAVADYEEKKTAKKQAKKKTNGKVKFE